MNHFFVLFSMPWALFGPTLRVGSSLSFCSTSGGALDEHDPRGSRAERAVGSGFPALVCQRTGREIYERMQNSAVRLIGEWVRRPDIFAKTYMDPICHIIDLRQMRAALVPV